MRTAYTMQTMLFVLSALLVLTMVGCDTDKEKEFSRKLHEVKIGMDKAKVEAILGKPDKIYTPEDHPGTWTSGTSEVWNYEGGPSCGGGVYFDLDGKVQYVYGQQGRIEPPEDEE